MHDGSLLGEGDHRETISVRMRRSCFLCENNNLQRHLSIAFGIS